MTDHSGENASMIRIEEAITAHWGPRCSEPYDGCPCCDAWKEYDALIRRAEQAERREAALLASNDADRVALRMLNAERDAIRAEKEKLERMLETLLGALKRISAPQYGLQGLMEDNAKEEDFTKYWRNMASGFASMARSAIAEYTRFKDGRE